jgi:hypothetical protein
MKKMEKSIHDYLKTVDTDEMQAIDLENSELNVELGIFNDYRRIEFEGAYYANVSTEQEFSAIVYGPFATIEEAEKAAQKDFDVTCRAASQIEEEMKNMEKETNNMEKEAYWNWLEEKRSSLFESLDVRYNRKALAKTEAEESSIIKLIKESEAELRHIKTLMRAEGI